MLKLNTTCLEQLVHAKDLEQAIAQNVPLLDAVKQGESCFSQSLGWHDLNAWASDDHICQFLAAAEKIRQEAEVLVLIGVGGSNNAARAVIEALRLSGPEVIYAGTSTSAHTICQALGKCDGKSVYVLNIAKNFETLEPGAAFRVFRDYLQRRYGPGYGQRILALGTPGSSLENLCRENGFGFLPFATDIGGRFTALSSVGLIPMAAAGIDIREVLQGAADMRQQLLATAGKENPALCYASARNLLYDRGYRIEMLASFQPQLRWFYKWWIQLFAESEGKEGKGIYPTAAEYSEDLHSVGQYVQDGSRILFETFLQVDSTKQSYILPSSDIPDGFDYLTGKDFTEVNRAACRATLDAHSCQIPCMEITLDALDAYHFGQLFYFFEFSCYLSGRILGINPFDQPGVEAYKQLMFSALGK